jgi:hypothetical protein
MSSYKTGGALKSYMVRVYREGLSERRKLVGIVEEVGIKGNRAFTNLDELWDIFSGKAIEGKILPTKGGQGAGEGRQT